MKPPRKSQLGWCRHHESLLALLLLVGASSPAFCVDFSEWQHRQTVSVPGSGIIKLSLPTDTLEAAQPGLSDLRVLDPSNSEVAYVLEQPRRLSAGTRQPKSFRVALRGNATLITVETGLALPLEGIALASPASSFIKAVQLEGSNDQQQWQLLSAGQPIFRQAGAAQLRLPLSGTWPYLRLTINDQRSQPVPFTAATLYAAEESPPVNESLPISLAERVENPGQTRLALNLGAANLDIASVRLDTPEPLFTRKVTFAVRQIAENTIREEAIGEGVLYRVQLPDQPAAANLSVALQHLVPSPELIVLIQNQDSPPLAITGVSAQRRPVYLVFVARQSGTFTVLTGNRHASAPRYDLASLSANLKNLPLAPLRLSSIAPNPLYRAPESLPEVSDTGAALDTAAWRFRKPLEPARAGVQQVELDPDVLAHAQPDAADLRLVRAGRQVPYILEHTSIARPLVPASAPANDPRKPQTSRWSLKLSHRGLPVDRLVCEANTPLFKRDLRLYELVTDDRGRDYEHELGQATWTQTPAQKTARFTLNLSARPQSDLLYLETYNGDNPPIALSNFQLYCPVTRLLFKSPAAPLHLYYGRRDVASPSYDLSLVAAQLLAADKATVLLGPEEELKAPGWSERANAGAGTIAFWAILGLVIVALLLLISRLLPKPAAPSAKA